MTWQPILTGAIALVPLAATPTGAQLLVGPPGTGAPFEEIVAAIGASNPGETIRVLPGHYKAFSLSGGRKVVGTGSGLVTVRGDDALPLVVVADNLAGSEARLSGMTILAPPAAGPADSPPSPLLAVDGNPGRIVSTTCTSARSEAVWRSSPSCS